MSGTKTRHKPLHPFQLWQARTKTRHIPLHPFQLWQARTKTRHIPLHPFQLWQARLLCGDSDNAGAWMGNMNEKIRDLWFSCHSLFKRPLPHPPVPCTSPFGGSIIFPYLSYKSPPPMLPLPLKVPLPLPIFCPSIFPAVCGNIKTINYKSALSVSIYTARKFNCLALCDEIFHHFPLFD